MATTLPPLRQAWTASTPAGLSSALQLVDASQLLFGSDAPLRNSRAQVEGLRAYGFSDQDLRKIDFENARRLLPRFNSC